MFQLVIASLFFFAPAEEENLLQAVPVDAKLVLSFSNVGNLRDTVESSTLNSFFDEPEVQAWIEAVDDWMGIDEAIDFDDDEGDEEPVSPRRLLESISGGAVLFLSVTGQEDWGVGVLVEPGDRRDEFDEFISGFMDYLTEEEGLSESTKSYREVELHLYEDAESEASEVTLLADNGETAMLVVADDVDKGVAQVHAILDTLAGEGEKESIVDAERFQQVRAKAGGPGDVEFYMDLQTLIQMALELEGAEPGSEQDLWRSVFSLEDLSAFYATGTVGKEKVSSVLYFGIQGEGLIRRLVDCLAGEPPLDFKKFTPSDAVGFSAMFMDINAFYLKCIETWSQLEKESYDQFRMMYDQMLKQQFKIDPEKEILALLNGKVGTFNVEVPPEEMEFMSAFQIAPADGSQAGPSVGYTYMVGLTDAKQFKANFDKLLRTFGLHVSKKSEEFQGYKLESLQLPVGNVRIYWSFVEGGMAISPFPTAIRACLRLVAQDDLPTIEENKGFMSILNRWPGASSVSAGKMETAVESFFAMFPTILTSMEMDFETGEAGGGDLPPITPLSGELIKKYFEGTMGSSMLVDEEGVTLFMAVE